MILMTAPTMPPVNLNLIQEIDYLWEPVYPYLAKHICELYGRQDGNILEVGPFCGLVFTLLEKGVGNSFSIAAFPAGMGDFFREEARKRKQQGKIEIVETDASLSGIEENQIDLAIFRGAFFFPFLFRVDFSKIHDVLRPNGMAVMGGGFGKFTPDAVIEDIGKRSRDLNLRIGKVEVNIEQLRQATESSRIKGGFEIISEGGLWVLMRK